MKSPILKAIAFCSILFVHQVAAQTQNNNLFFGSQHTIVGNASLISSNSKVIVQNLGSAGQDGVAIHFRDSEFHLNLESRTYPIGSTLDESIYGHELGKSEERIGNIHMRFNQQSDEILPDFSSIGKKSYSITILDQNFNTVAVRTGLTGATMVINPNNNMPPVAIRACWHKKYDSNGDVSGYYASLHRVVADASEETYQLPNGELFKGSLVLLMAELDSNPQQMVYSKASVIGSKLGYVTIEGEWLLKFQHIFHEALGETKFHATENAIIVSNGGMLPEYMTRMEFLEYFFGRVNYFEWSMNVPKLNQVPHNSYFMSKAYALFGKDDISVGFLKMKKDQEGFEITPNFQDIGSTSYTLNLYENGRQVSSVLMKGTAGTLKLPTAYSDSFSIRTGFDINKIFLKFNSPQKFQTTDGKWETPDRIEFIANAPSISYSTLAFVDLTSKDISEYIINDGTTIRPKSDKVAEHNTDEATEKRRPENPVSLQLFPNPANGIFKIQINGSFSGPILINISDIHGKKYSANQLGGIIKDDNGISLELDISNLPDGIYLCSLSLDGQVITKKIVIDR